MMREKWREEEKRSTCYKERGHACEHCNFHGDDERTASIAKGDANIPVDALSLWRTPHRASSLIPIAFGVKLFGILVRIGQGKDCLRGGQLMAPKASTGGREGKLFLVPCPSQWTIAGRASLVGKEGFEFVLEFLHGFGAYWRILVLRAISQGPALPSLSEGP